MILCCGEALIDMIPSHTEDDQLAYVPHSGGAVFNTAIALGRLGIRTGLLAGLSNDLFGKQLVGSLHASNVETAYAIHSDRPTTLAFVQLSAGNATYTFFDENSAGRMVRTDDLPELPGEISALYFGGISLACEPSADTFAALLDRECSGRVIMLDVNVRPGFISDVGRYRQRLERMIANADIVKVSEEDLNWLYRGDVSIDQKVSQIRQLDPSVVILTRGGEGATAYLRSGKKVFSPAKRVSVVDTVGAGDTFNAGILAKLYELGAVEKKKLAQLDQRQLSKALEFGTAVSAITVSRAGANPPWTRELNGDDK